MNRYFVLIVIILSLLLWGCGNNSVTDDIKDNSDTGNAWENTTPVEPELPAEEITTPNTEGGTLADYVYYDRSKINIADWTVEIPVITVPAKIITGGVTYRYVYNDDGYRIAKYVGDEYRIDYEYEQPPSGAQQVLKSEKSDKYTVEYTYDDVDGIYRLKGFKYNGNEYSYITDEIGFITGIADSNGDIAAEYSYISHDLSTEVVTSNYTDENIGDINSMLFENAYYDRETGFCCDYVYTNYVDGKAYQIKDFY